MPPDERDAGYLWDMLKAARAVRQFVADRTLDQYLADEFFQAAVERKIEIIGEAARGVSAAFESQHPQVPWQAIVAQRHVLAHEYGTIEQQRIWHVATVRIPELIPHLESMLDQPAED